MKAVEIHPHLFIEDLALRYKNILIISDLQLGYEEALESQGILLPRFQLKDIIERLDNIFMTVSVEKVVINGDLKHEFGTITNQEWRDTLRLFDYLLTKVKEIIIIKGNHDLALEPIATKRNIHVVDSYVIDNISILHGHIIPLQLQDIIIIGHEHPAISFPELKTEKYKCFLKGPWQKKTLIVMPSFTPLTIGSDVTRERPLSPFLKHGVQNFHVFVVEDTVRYFGTVGDVSKL